MRSIKPGRGPSAMSAIGGVVGVLFGIFWTIMAFALTRNAPFPLVGTIFPLFGVLFVCVGIASVIYNARNATSRDRLSDFDITTDREEPDPLNQAVSRRSSSGPALPPRAAPERFCTQCGAALRQDFRFCPACGNQQP